MDDDKRSVAFTSRNLSRIRGDGLLDDAKQVKLRVSLGMMILTRLFFLATTRRVQEETLRIGRWRMESDQTERKGGADLIMAGRLAGVGGGRHDSFMSERAERAWRDVGLGVGSVAGLWAVRAPCVAR
jgi:hypothetical protein